jgi:hypothetical protein
MRPNYRNPQGCPGTDLAIDGAGPAHRLAPRHNYRLCLQGRGRGSQVPAMWPVSRLPDVVPVLQVDGQMVKVGIVGPGLQKQHRLAGILGQPRRHNATRGTAPHNDVVVFHGTKSPLQQNLRTPIDIDLNQNSHD